MIEAFISNTETICICKCFRWSTYKVLPTYKNKIFWVNMTEVPSNRMNETISFTIRSFTGGNNKIKPSVWRKRNFLKGSKATNCSTMGISWRQFITIDQQVAGERSDGKKPNRHDKGPFASAQSTIQTHTDNSNPSYKPKNAHKWHEGIPPARRNYLGLSISVSRTIEMVSLSPSKFRHHPVSFAFDSFMTVDLNGFETCFFFPQMPPLGKSGARRLHASRHSIWIWEKLYAVSIARLRPTKEVIEKAGDNVIPSEFN